MDVPIDVVEWELFVPEQFKVDHFDGNLIDASLVSLPDRFGMAAASPVSAPAPPPPPAQLRRQPQWGQITGVVVDSAGGMIPGAQVTLTNGTYRQSVTTDADGNYMVSNVPSGAVTIVTELTGFRTTRRTVQFAQAGQRADAVLELGGVAETVTVSAATSVIDTQRSSVEKQKKDEVEAPSANIQNLQRRASGVLPVRIDVPRAGTSHSFVKPLVLDEETEITFRYKRR
jgi:hypothetical protein